MNQLASKQPATVAILTVSDTRTSRNDESGSLIQRLLLNHSYQLLDIQRCKDDNDAIHSVITPLIQRTDTDAIIVSGGTGISRRDVTIEAISPLFDKELIGFGELFRMLSYNQDVGSRAMLSRATAGVINEKLIFLLPGSPAAVELAMTRLIIPELEHLLREIHK